MPWKDWVPLMKYGGSLLAFLLYTVSFARSSWVVTPDTEWGLWSWCFTNFSDTDKAEDHANASTRCHTIQPGHSPGYYEAARTFACFTLVTLLLFLFTCNPKEGLGVGYKPSIVACVACAGTVIVLSTLGSQYREDRRWRDKDPDLGWCFWLAMVSGILSFLLIFVLRIYNKIQEDSGGAVTQDPNADRLQRRDSNASSFSLHGDLKVTIFRMSPEEGAGGSSRPQTSPGDAASAISLSTVSCRTGDGGGDGGQFPMLNLHRYNLPPEPGISAQTVPPPSYENVVGGRALSPPPPYVVTESAEHKSG